MESKALALGMSTRYINWFVSRFLRHFCCREKSVGATVSHLRFMFKAASVGLKIRLGAIFVVLWCHNFGTLFEIKYIYVLLTSTTDTRNKRIKITFT
jgi:hypothetical protein